MRTYQLCRQVSMLGIALAGSLCLLSFVGLELSAQNKPLREPKPLNSPSSDPRDLIDEGSSGIPSHNKLFKNSAFTDGTIRGYWSSYSGGGWDVEEKSVRVYANKRQTKYADITLASVANPISTVALYLYDYDANGLVSQVLRPDWGRWTYTYNDSGKTLTSLSSYFSPGGEVPQLRSTYSYIRSTILTQVLSETYANGVWTNSARTTYFSDSTGTLDSASYESWQNRWVLGSKTFYSYDTLNRAKIALFCVPDAITGAMIPQSRTTSTSDVYGSLVQMQTDYYTGTGGLWIPSSRIQYTYDSEGYIQVQRYTYWDSYNSTWSDYYKYECSKYPSPSVTLVAPNPGDTYVLQAPIRIRWLASGTSSVDLFSSTNNGSSWQTIATNVPDTGAFSYVWPAPSVESSQCKVKVVSSGNSSVQDLLDGTFSTNNIVTKVEHTTNNIRMSVLNNGYLGADPNGNGSGFVYKSSPNALFSAGVFVGTTSGTARGMVGSFNLADFQNTRPLRPLTSNVNFDQVSSAGIAEISPTYYCNIGVRSQSRTCDDFVFVSYTLKNVGYSAWPDMYLGVFADWDIGNPFSNSGGVDSARGLAYENEMGSSLSDSNYYGVLVLSRFSGATVTTGTINAGTLVSTIRKIQRPVAPGDQRLFAGSGPFAINALDSVIIDFALVAGSSLADLQAHADSARNLWRVAVLTGPTCQISCSSVNFGTVSVGKTKKDSVMVANQGTLSLAIAAVTSTNSRFSVSPTAASVPTGGTQKFYITFSPLASGQQTGKIVFTHNALSIDSVTVSGNGVVGAVEIRDGTIPRSFELRDNYPNPFNPSTTIEYGLPAHSRVVVKVYSLLGQEIATLVDDVQEAGYHRTVWSGQQHGVELASGVYLVRMSARPVGGGAAFVQVKKMLLLR